MSKVESGKPYTVEEHDTISELAYLAYGDARRYVDIIAANEGLRGFDPVRLSVGQVIDIPEPSYRPSPEGLGYRESISHTQGEREEQP